jgi:hypothetical protein
MKHTRDRWLIVNLLLIKGIVKANPRRAFISGLARDMELTVNQGTDRQ